MPDVQPHLTRIGALFATCILACGCGMKAARERQTRDALPTDVRSSLRAEGITVEDGPLGESRTTKAQAIREAAALDFGGALTSAHLVRYTDPDDCEYENDLAAGQPEINRCKPLSIDRLAWLVVFRDAEVPIHGPPGRGGGTYDATIAAFVDAVTGRGIVAMTLPD